MIPGAWSGKFVENGRRSSLRQLSGPDGDELRRDGDGDLLRRLGPDGKADGGVDAGVLRLGEALGQEAVLAEGQLPAGAQKAG